MPRPPTDTSSFWLGLSFCKTSFAAEFFVSRAVGLLARSLPGTEQLGGRRTRLPGQHRCSDVMNEDRKMWSYSLSIAQPPREALSFGKQHIVVKGRLDTGEYNQWFHSGGKTVEYKVSDDDWMS